MSNIAPGAIIGEGCEIAPTAIIRKGVELGAGSTVGDFVILGEGYERIGRPLRIGKNSTIRSHAIFYAGSEFGDDLSTGHHCLIREDIKAGVNLQIGSFDSLEGLATIGDYVRFHSNVNIGRGSVIGDLIWIFPNVSLLNDPIPPSGLMRGVTIEDGAVIGADTMLLPAATVGFGAFIAAKSKAGGTLPPASFVSGDPAKVLGDIRLIRDFLTKKRHPWMGHFSGYYPDSAQGKIDAIHKRIQSVFDVNDAERRQKLSKS